MDAQSAIFNGCYIIILQVDDAVCVLDYGRSIRSEEIFHLFVFEGHELGGDFYARHYWEVSTEAEWTVGTMFCLRLKRFEMVTVM
jgi:hypothetical protein